MEGNRSKILRLAEEITEYAEISKDYETPEKYYDHAAALLIMELIGRIRESAEQENLWATIETFGDSFEPGQKRAARSVMAIVNQWMQDEGFQTDEVYEEREERFILQLKVFWFDGKRLHEDLELLGKIDPQFLTRVEPPEIVNKQVPFRPYIVEPEP